MNTGKFSPDMNRDNLIRTREIEKPGAVVARGVDGRGDDARRVGDGEGDGDTDGEGESELGVERGRARGSSPEQETKSNANTVAAITPRRIDLLVADDQIGGHGYGLPGPGSG